MSEQFDINDYTKIGTNDACDGCAGCAGELNEAICDNLYHDCAGCIFVPKPTRESLLAEIAELDRQKEIKERELRELSNKEQGDEQ